VVDVRSLELSDARQRSVWDRFIEAHPDGSAMHLTAWGRAIEQALGHVAIYLAAWRGEEIVGALPLILVRSPLFGVNLVSNAFSVYGGPVCDDQAANDALDVAAWKIAQDANAKSLEYRNQRLLRPDWPTKSDVYATFKRPISAVPDQNLLAIPRKQRAEVRKSLEKGLSVQVNQNASTHFAVYSESVRNLGTPVFSPKLFKALLHFYGASADILTVYNGDRPVSSVLSLYFKNEVLPYYGGGVADARELRANDHMYYKLMEHAAARGCTSFDFGRSKFGTGAFAFKKNWGFEAQPLHYAYKLAEGQEMPNLNPNSPKYQRVVQLWQKLPLSAANLVGPWISRGLG
jgi:FemAB-related protein (PEP-CTERM system-associated)